MIKTDIKLHAGGYIAELRTDLGGACYRLKNELLNLEILRTPPTEEALSDEFYLFGNPILFPPNRISGGSFEFSGREYRFPINEPSTGCHLHGELSKKPFTASDVSDSRAVLTYTAEAGEYLGFPHAFRVVRDYRLSEDGLTERTSFENLSGETVPFMLAYHTTFDISGLGDRPLLEIPVVREQLRDEKYLPTLEWGEGRPRDLAISSGEYAVRCDKLSALYKTSGKFSRITDPVSRISIISECSEEFGYRMLWRKADADFLCIEPQTVAIDCFHLDSPAEELGLISVPKGETVTLTARYAAEKF